MTSAVNIHIPRHNLTLLSMPELSVVMDAATNARNAILGVKNQPRCQGKAETELADLLDKFNGLVDLIADVAEKFTPTTADDAIRRAYLIIHHETTYVDHFGDVLASAQVFQQGITALKRAEGDFE